MSSSGKLFTKNMDNIDPLFTGFTQELAQILKTLGVDKTSPAAWSIRQTSTKIYLDLAWSRDVEFPAKTPNNATGTQQVSTATKTSQMDIKTSVDNPRMSKPHKKRKSPSTKKRDRIRYLAWVERKRKHQSSDPKSKTTDSESSDNASIAACVSIKTTTMERLTSSVENTHSPAHNPTVEHGTVHVTPSVTSDSQSSEAPSQLSKTPTNSQFSVPDKDDGGSSSNEVEQTVPAWRADFDMIADGLPMVGPDLAKVCCWSCFSPGAEGLKKCTQCSMAQYCSRECQRDHWKANHANFCKKILAWQKNYSQQGVSSMDAPGTLH